MNTGMLSREQRHSKHCLRISGAAICLFAAFALGWSANAKIAVNGSDNSVVVHEPLFSPNGGARDAIKDQIDQADNEIMIALYYFTDPVLAEALIAAGNRGVAIQVILDRSQRNGRHSQAQRLSDAGIKVHFDSRHRILHHKFMVVDSRTVITGSQNWTKSAEIANAENTLILRNVPLLARQYRTEFLALYARAEKSAAQEKPL